MPNDQRTVNYLSSVQIPIKSHKKFCFLELELYYLSCNFHSLHLQQFAKRMHVRKVTTLNGKGPLTEQGGRGQCQGRTTGSANLFSSLI